MAQTSFIPQAGERAFVAGQTGSGKTTFVIWLLLRIEVTPIIIYDLKDEKKFPHLPNNKIVYSMEDVRKEIDNPELDYIIMRPPEDMLGDPAALDDLLFYHYMHLKHTGCFVDELVPFMRNGRGGKGLINILQRGRSKGITFIGCTQRPKGIERGTITEMNHGYIFKLKDKDDRKRIDDISPNFSDLPLPPKHGFYYLDEENDSVELYKPVKLDPAFETGYVDQGGAEENSSPTLIDNPGTKHVWI